jgi:hypothetical protein
MEPHRRNSTVKRTRLNCCDTMRGHTEGRLLALVPWSRGAVLGFMPIRVDSCESVSIRADSCRFMPIRVDSWRFYDSLPRMSYGVILRRPGAQPGVRRTGTKWRITRMKRLRYNRVWKLASASRLPLCAEGCLGRGVSLDRDVILQSVKLSISQQLSNRSVSRVINQSANE